MSLKADLLFINARVFDQGQNLGQSDAVAISQGRILAVGQSRDLKHLMSKKTMVIDLAGGSLLPGFFDPHLHFYEWSLKRSQLDLSQATSLDDLLQKLARFHADLPKDQWLLGFSWNEVDWPNPVMPTREYLDKVAPDRPVALWRCDFHLAVVNSKALEMAGIGPNTPDPAEGRIEKDVKGEPTGVLRELAINLIRDKIPAPTDKQVMNALQKGIEAAHALGITALQDVRLMDDLDGPAMLRAARRLEEKGLLDLRLWVSLAGNQLDQAVALGLRTGLGSDRLKIGHIKYFSDGGMGGRTAWMLEPYLDAQTGMPLIDPVDLEKEVAKAQSAGLAVMIHAVGDRAVREVIGVFEKTATQPLPGDVGPALAHRIEHVQNIHPDDLPRLGRLPIAACLTPPNLVLDINTVDKSVGQRGRCSYALKDILASGVPTMFSSDCPVCSPDPLLGIRAAVTRQRLDNTPPGGWHPESKISTAQAVKAYTEAPALLHNVGKDLGRVAPGYRADLVVLDKDILACPPEDLHRLKVRFTVFDGRLVHQAD